MIILNERPPEWIMTGCLSKFRVNVDHTFWTYGDTIYNPGGHEIPDHTVAHEEQHSRQQEALEGGKDAWWKEYLSNPRFRLEQEAEAYSVQYKYYRKFNGDRNYRSRFLNMIANQLSSPLYQLAVTQLQAKAIIEVLAGVKKLPQSGKSI